MSFKKSPYIATCFVLACCFLFIFSSAMLQNHKGKRGKVKTEQAASSSTISSKILDTTRRTARLRNTTLQFGNDSVGNKIDSLGRDSLRDSAQISTLKEPVFSTAKDSIVEDFTEGKRMIYYYGVVTVK